MTTRARYLPILLRPKWLAFRNYWKRGANEPGQRLRDTVIGIFALAVMLGIYGGGIWMVEQAQAQKGFLYFHPSLPLGLLFLFLFGMLFLSSAASTAGSLFMSQDLDLILSSEISPWRFFSSKCLDVAIESSWVTMIFILPAVFSFAPYYHPSPLYYPLVFAVLVPFFCIPAALTVTIVTLYAQLIPAQRTKGAVRLLFVIWLLLLYVLASMISGDKGLLSFSNIEGILRLVSILSVPNAAWNPSYWASTALAESLSPTGKSIALYLILLYATAIFLVSVAYVVFRFGYLRAYSKACLSRKQARLNSRRSRMRFRRVRLFCPQTVWAFVGKEYKQIFRDISQLFQLLLLSTICMIYFYNFRVITAIQRDLPEESRAWWDGFLFITNTSLEAFLMTAVGTRFVFQSVSLEGRAIWHVLTAPISLQRYLRTKFVTWYFPIAIVLSAIFGAGAIASGAPALLVLFKIVVSWVLCFGIVGLGVGLGAYYANFSWEHSSQLAASFGSLIYMMGSIALIMVDGALFGFILLCQHLHEKDPQWLGSLNYVGMGGGFLLLLLLNCLVARWALRLGDRALTRKMG